jgi:SSS family solute:Na+ symporter
LASSVELHAWRGTTPVLDGRISPGEWSDASSVPSISGWSAQFAPVSAASDLSAQFWIKHDERSLWVAAQVTDDYLYARDTPAWLPGGNPAANSLTRDGWPWFGDESELLFSAAPPARAANASVAGNASQWQMVINAFKSRLGGLGMGGLLEGEPRSSAAAWSTYQDWILRREMEAAVTWRGGAGGGSQYSWEWRVAFGCLEVQPGVFYHADLPTTAVGFNIALGDSDRAGDGDHTYGLRHEMWLSGTTCNATNCHTLMNEFATLFLEPGPKPGAAAA